MTDHRSEGWIAALALLWLVHLSGCGSGVGRACEVDADCGEDQICAAEQCRRTCTTDEDCRRPTYTCRSWVEPTGDDPVNLCRPSADAGGGDTEEGCTSDEECRARFDAGNARCGIDGRCIIASRHYGLLIDDRTEVTDMGPAERRGAEIGAVFLTDEAGGAPALHARTVDYNPGGGLDGESHLDGNPVDLDGANACVTPPLPDHTTPLGGGELLVEFTDASGNSATIAEGDRAAIVEWAETNCGSSEGDVDEYDVYLCVSETGSLRADDCDRQLVDAATGYTTTVLRSD